MKSEAFEDFHLSDLEYGVRAHHDQLRALLPVMQLAEAPQEDRIAALSADLAVAARAIAAAGAK